ncbi:uncharacterized protein LOC144119491 isoform X2 [Amblyomma americanum]
MENVVKKEGPPAKRQRDNSRCSTDQWIVMIDFLCVHKSLSRATSDLSPETRQRLWSELTSLLNAMGPTSKTSEDWHRYWQSRVAAARHRAEELAAAERKRSADGAHAASPIRLSEDDARVLSIVGDELALEVRRGHVVQKRLESPSPASAAASPPNKEPPKCRLQQARNSPHGHRSRARLYRTTQMLRLSTRGQIRLRQPLFAIKCSSTSKRWKPAPLASWLLPSARPEPCKSWKRRYSRSCIFSKRAATSHHQRARSSDQTAFAYFDLYLIICIRNIVKVQEALP